MDKFAEEYGRVTGLTSHEAVQLAHSFNPFYLHQLAKCSDNSEHFRSILSKMSHIKMPGHIWSHLYNLLRRDRWVQRAHELYIADMQ